MKNKTYNKKEAIKVAESFIEKIKELQDKTGMTLTSDTNLYLIYLTKDKDCIFDNVKIGWIGDGSGLRVLEQHDKEFHKQQALNKLTPKEREALGL